MSDSQKKELKQHLRCNIYLEIKPIIEYVHQTFSVQYSVSGMTKLLHELNFEYKKPIRVPGKANIAAQEEWVANDEKLRAAAKKGDAFYFVDGVHPQHNSHPAYGWFEKGVEVELPSNSGRQRVNINSAVNIDTLNIVVEFTDSVNTESVKRLMDQLIKDNPNAPTIYLILDNASYYHSKDVEEYRKKLGKIKFIFLPPYSPKLNLIERVWKFFKKKTLYNKYYEKFADFVRGVYSLYQSKNNFVS